METVGINYQSKIVREEVEAKPLKPDTDPASGGQLDGSNCVL